MLEGDTPRLLPLPCYVENSVSYSLQLFRRISNAESSLHIHCRYIPLCWYPTFVVSLWITRKRESLCRTLRCIAREGRARITAVTRMLCGGLCSFAAVCAVTVPRESLKAGISHIDWWSYGGLWET
jgi:hypothetical protein